MTTAANLRKKAIKLLLEAEAVDANQPFQVLVYGGPGTPETHIIWAAQEPTEQEALTALAFSEAELANESLRVVASVLNLNDVLAGGLAF